jgi:hypothetical protein
LKYRHCQILFSVASDGIEFLMPFESDPSKPSLRIMDKVDPAQLPGQVKLVKIHAASFAEVSVIEKKALRIVFVQEQLGEKGKEAALFNAIL